MTNQELFEFQQLLLTFNKMAAQGITDIYEKFLLSALPKSLPLFTHLISYNSFPTLERVTINRNILGTNKRIRDIKFLKYPPADLVKKYGRCNLKNNSILYAAPMVMTALSEMRPKVGDLITKSVWKLKEEHSFKICPIFHVQPTNGTTNLRTMELSANFYKIVERNFHNENEKKAVIALSEFIAFHFSKDVNPSNDKDYLFSAYFANRLLNELDGGTIEGIVYPSVKERLSFENVALKPEVFDKYYILEEVHESYVIKDPSDGGGGLLMNGINDCKEFDFAEGKILWSETVMQPKEEFDYFRNIFKIDLD